MPEPMTKEEAVKIVRDEVGLHNLGNDHAYNGGDYALGLIDGIAHGMGFSTSTLINIHGERLRHVVREALVRQGYIADASAPPVV